MVHDSKKEIFALKKPENICTWKDLQVLQIINRERIFLVSKLDRISTVGF